MLQLPQMKPYPQDKSVLILDNCAIHKSQLLREVVEAHGSVSLIYSPICGSFLRRS